MSRAVDPVLAEAKRLYKLGFAILWIHKKSKRPVESKWTTGSRTPWVKLEATYKSGYNVGVRTGEPSKIGDKFLACIDVDIKDPELHDVAFAKLQELIGHKQVPSVLSGSGGGSCHMYCVTPTHFKMITVAKEKGWEICIYSDGRQMVLPPSIHPSGGKYMWSVEGGGSDFPEMDFDGVVSVIGAKDKAPREAKERSDSPEGPFDFQVEEVELDWRVEISDKVMKGIKYGTDIVDRSGFLLPAASALHSAGLNKNQILSVLTSPSNFLSGCAFDHAQTRDRNVAARWLWRYTVRKVFAERSAGTVFGAVTGEDSGYTRLTPEQAAAQTAEMLAEEISWKAGLDRTKQGKLLPTVQNVVLVLKNDVDPKVVRRNEFAFRDAYSVETPWGGNKDASLTDDDTAKIKHWFGSVWGVEPGNGSISDALTVIACDNAFDPVRDWLDHLPAWDGVTRLDTWLVEYFEAEGDHEYLAQVFRKWMTAMVMRVYRPGAKFDWMPIFEGVQGVGKSSFGRVLVGDQYFLDWLPNLGDKDAALGLQGMWSIEMGELSQFRKNELETIKAFITRTVDKFRPPHGKKLIESPRRCVFFGTTNRDKYLGDDSGNRRFKPVKVGRLDFDQLRKDRIQLFAEAKMWFEKSTELDLELIGQAKVYESKIHREKMIEDDATAMQEAMEDFLIKVADKTAILNVEKFRLLELFSGGGPLQKWVPTTRNLMFAGKMLKAMNGDKRTIQGLNYWRVEPHQERGISDNFY